MWEFFGFEKATGSLSQQTAESKENTHQIATASSPAASQGDGISAAHGTAPQVSVTKSDLKLGRLKKTGVDVGRAEQKWWNDPDLKGVFSVEFIKKHVKVLPPNSGKDGFYVDLGTTHHALAIIKEGNNYKTYLATKSGTSISIIEPCLDEASENKLSTLLATVKDATVNFEDWKTLLEEEGFVLTAVMFKIIKNHLQLKRGVDVNRAEFFINEEKSEPQSRSKTQTQRWFEEKMVLRVLPENYKPLESKSEDGFYLPLDNPENPTKVLQVVKVSNVYTVFRATMVNNTVKGLISPALFSTETDADDSDALQQLLYEVRLLSVHFKNWEMLWEEPMRTAQLNFIVKYVKLKAMQDAFNLKTYQPRAAPAPALTVRAPASDSLTVRVPVSAPASASFQGAVAIAAANRATAKQKASQAAQGKRASSSLSGSGAPLPAAAPTLAPSLSSKSTATGPASVETSGLSFPSKPSGKRVSKLAPSLSAQGVFPRNSNQESDERNHGLLSDEMKRVGKRIEERGNIMSGKPYSAPNR